MCDEDTAAEHERALAASGLSAVGPAPLPASPHGAIPVAQRDVAIETPDGVCDGCFVAPTTGRHPGVLVWPDVIGLRPAFEQMAHRLAQDGYAVLVVNPFYRSAKAPIVQPGEDWSVPEVRARIAPWRAELTPARTVSDAETFVSWLDAQDAVDRARGMASTGYCMGGAMAVRTAAARRDRIRAGASFHGAGLVTDDTDSPHRLVPEVDAKFLFAIAEGDDAKSPLEKTVLRTAFAGGTALAEIEVYPGAAHGWCPPDNKVHNQAQAERAWARQLALLGREL